MPPSLLRPSKPTLAYTLQLHYRLDSWTSLASLLRGSDWYERPVSYFAYDDEILLLSNSYRVTQSLFKAANHHDEAIGMCINVSKTDLKSALIPGAQRLVGLLHDGPQKDVDKFKYLGSMFIAKGQDAEENGITIYLARSAFPRLQSCLWLRREIFLGT